MLMFAQAASDLHSLRPSQSPAFSEHNLRRERKRDGGEEGRRRDGGVTMSTAPCARAAATKQRSFHAGEEDHSVRGRDDSVRFRLGSAVRMRPALMWFYTDGGAR